MPNVWFTADFHLGHKNIIRYCNRPFDTVEEMNRTILEQLNSLVKTNGILYFLGDFFIGPRALAKPFARGGSPRLGRSHILLGRCAHQDTDPKGG